MIFQFCAILHFACGHGLRPVISTVVEVGFEVGLPGRLPVLCS
jgi:hypothetical protein